MKKGGKSANMYVMFSLLAVLFVSLGYLAMQGGGREGMPKEEEEKAKEEEEKAKAIAGPAGKLVLPPAIAALTNKQGFRGREGMAHPKKK